MNSSSSIALRHPAHVSVPPLSPLARSRGRVETKLNEEPLCLKIARNLQFRNFTLHLPAVVVFTRLVRVRASFIYISIYAYNTVFARVLREVTTTGR